MIINADLHIHSQYSTATSPRMDLPTLATEALRKGIQLLGTGDCLQPRWLQEIKELEERNGIFYFKPEDEGTTHTNTNFVLTVEVEDTRRVHHLLIVPSISKAEELYESFRKYSQDINSDGRPSLRLNGAEIAEYARDAEALIGPCHAFTPWTALYAYHDSLKACYGDMAGYISFVELGLSADSSYADRIGELHDLTFLTNSDAHSPYPIRLAREFNRFHVEDMSFEELKAAIKRERGRKPVLNVGFPPQEGKYNESACIRCYTHYSLTEAVTRRWRCECGGLIKKGVRDRVNELADCDGAHPEHRPSYLHLIPLAEVIGLAVQKSPSSKAVQKIWEALLAEFGDEVTVLIDASIDSILGAHFDSDFNLDALKHVGEAIRAFRAGEIRILPGGGGKYGVIEFKTDANRGVEELEVEQEPERGKMKQRSLLDF
ncbi:MAG TPA: TIGR00375 family protein [Candidatus Bathyarchaeia archaeon]|nr:TIGR00375 family protein [Candidatus Bathyarchaeia archaeon]